MNNSNLTAEELLKEASWRIVSRLKHYSDWLEREIDAARRENATSNSLVAYGRGEAFASALEQFKKDALI